MRAILAVVVALVFSSGVVFAADMSGQQGGSTGGAGTQQMDKEKTVTATVDNVNAGQKKIAITGSKGNKAEYTLSDNTMITTPSGEQKQIGDLKPGSKVTITYTGTRPDVTVTRVEIQKGK